MTEPILVSFYQDTEKSGTYYKDSADRLRKQAKEVGQDYSIVKRNYGKDYLSVTRAKPTFMLEMLKKHKGRDVVFVDVDSEILKPFDFTFDTLAWAVKPNGQPYGHIHYLPNNEETIKFLEDWQAMLEDWEGGDHSALWVLVKTSGIKWSAIPNPGARIRFNIAQTFDARDAHVKLQKINWTQTIQKRLAGG